MAEPKKKLSKTRTNLRRAQYKAKSLQTTRCSNCGQPSLPHHVCPHCGFYNGQPALGRTPAKRIQAQDTK